MKHTCPACGYELHRFWRDDGKPDVLGCTTCWFATDAVETDDAEPVMSRGKVTSRLVMACPEVWPAVTACHAWGAASSHGCKLSPGHDGLHVCLCGRSESSQNATVSNPQEPNARRQGRGGS